MNEQKLFDEYFNKGLRMKIFEHKDRIKYYKQYLECVNWEVILNDIISKVC